ncbi:DUF4145 domain-containing protein [Candidatus Microgenomates bacterium]|nr:MAG: DUF4145 domain-containing protein [Candidatus Microgenomates bacterium]
MADRYYWTCPFCDRDSTLGSQDYDDFSSGLRIENSDGGKKVFQGLFIVCPNPKCKKITLTASLHVARQSGYDLFPGEKTHTWSLIPNSKAKPFPSYIPSAIIKDYNEACLVRDLSPKSSATLARRCLQGMISDYHGIKKRNLNKAINAVKTKVDPLTWKAIDGVRSIGNIGAHMEKDINLIVDVEPEEADELIKLIEILINDWYINRYEREESLKAVIGTADEKKQARKGNNKVEQTIVETPTDKQGSGQNT